ncbi:hypothetical protein EMCRGX_G021171 [Ephydatia muelleri]|eukprot:Em0016g1044a
MDMDEDRETLSDDDEMDDVEEEEEDEGEDGENATTGEEPKQVYLPGQPLEEGEELVYDHTAYHMYHEAQTGAPCLSFDVLRDSLGNQRTEYPMTVYLVAGTQAEDSKPNFIVLMKMADLKRTSQNDEDSEDEEAVDDEDTPQLDTIMIQHEGVINRLRVASMEERHLVATWSDSGVVGIWDCSKHVLLLDAPSAGGMAGKNLKGHKETPLFTFSGHQVEGFAMDWSKTVAGRLATGDCTKNIHIWNPSQGTWLVDQRPLCGHTKSVEDIQWSPNEPSVLASCSVDQTIRVWDCRANPSKACMLTTHAHDTDVNVISWNRSEPLLVSGADDGTLKIWDFRQFKSGVPAATFKHHTAAISSVEWHPSDSSVFASAGSDDQVVQWDLAVEVDTEAGAGVDQEHLDIPPQLLFIHQGQTDIKELHWHPQVPGVLITTALSGFNIFKTISV